MYAVNASVPKTLTQYLVRYAADTTKDENVRKTLIDIVETPISPELKPADDKGEIAQKTEDLVGPYELHDFFLYYVLRCGFRPSKIYWMAQYAFLSFGGFTAFFFQTQHDTDSLRVGLQDFFLIVCHSVFF